MFTKLLEFILTKSYICYSLLFIVIKYLINGLTKTKLFNYIYSKIYDHFFGDDNFRLATPNLYNYTINKLNNNSKVLDFGCGNGICYNNIKVIENIKNKNLKVIGVDIDKIYINECNNRIVNNHLQDYIETKLINIFDYKLNDNEEKFDYAIFSESAPVIPSELLFDFVDYINNNLIKEDGQIIFINNLSQENNKMKIIKPYIKYISLIDFGVLLTENDFIKMGNKLNKKVIINLIDSMKLKEILSYFNLNLLYPILYLCGITNYEVEQYEIIFTNKK